jgi:hypothetical protein
MTTAKSVAFEDLLDTIMMEEPEPTYAALQRWVARYPEHRQALASFFATWAVQEEMPEEAEAKFDEERVHQEVLAHAQAILDGAPRLLRVAELAGVSREELAARCDLDASLVARLDARFITVATIPGELLRRLGEVLARGVDEVRKMLDGPPVADPAEGTAGAAGMQGAFAGAVQGVDTKRLLIKIDFARAVQISQLPEESKRRWTDAT